MKQLPPIRLLVSMHACLLAASASAQVGLEWVAVTNVSNPPPPAPAYDAAADIRADALGNVYITGSSMEPVAPLWFNLMTVKYAPNGTELWVRVYDGLPGYDDVGNALRVDSAGNVYVTGESDADLVTLKYDTNGNLLWEDRYTQGARSFGRRIEIAPDGAIYVMGGVNYLASDPTDNYLTIRYLPDGTRDWVRLSDNGIVTAVPAHRKDDPAAMTVDASSNVYITGTSSAGIPTYDNVRTVKYGPNGQLLWNVSYSAHLGDQARSISLSPDGKVYVGGQIGYVPGQGDLAYVIQYQPNNGQQLGVTALNTGTFEEIVSLAAAAAGGIYFAGCHMPYGSTSRDWIVGWIDGAGAIAWTASYASATNGFDRPSHAVSDAQGNLFVTGYRGGAPLTQPNNDVVTIQYGPAGQVLWTKVYDWGSEGAARIALGGPGEIYLAGGRRNLTAYPWGFGAVSRAITMKYSLCSGSLEAYGAGCPGSDDVTPIYGVVGCPEPGRTLTFEVSAALGGSLAILVFGLNQASLPLPGGCLLRVDPLLPFFPTVALSGGASGHGAGSIPLFVPPGSSGAVVTSQAFVLDGGVPQGFSNTNGIDISIQ